MIALTIVGAAIAVMHYKYSPNPVPAQAVPAGNVPSAKDEDEEVL